MRTLAVFVLSLVVTYVASTPVSDLSETAKLKQLLRHYIERIEDKEIQAKSSDVYTAYLGNVMLTTRSGRGVKYTTDTPSAVVLSSNIDDAAEFKRVPCLAASKANSTLRPQCVSMMSVDKQGWYVRHYNYFLWLEPLANPRNASIFDVDSSFIVRPEGYDGGNIFSFESVNNPGYFITAREDGNLKIVQRASNNELCSSATFKFNVLDAYRCDPQLIKQIDTTNVVCRGLALMDDKIFAIYWGSDTIRVFGLNYEQLEGIRVRGLVDPTDIVANSEIRSLYVGDWSSVCVWRVGMDGQVAKFTTTRKNPGMLSLMSGRLLVAQYQDVLSLYGADGVELKNFVHPNTSGLLHAVETSRGTFVVCYYTPKPQVVEIDINGRIISAYNNQQQRLALPHYLSIDSRGKMFLADHNNHSILLLTSDLQLERVLINREHNQLAENPWRLLYVKQTRHLLVASAKSHVIQVFALG